MRATDEFRRVAVSGRSSCPARRRWSIPSGSSLRPRRRPAPATGCSRRRGLTGGSIVVVNRGFVPEGRQNSTRAKDETPRPAAVDIVGVMRWPEQRGQFTPADEPQKRLWFARDPASMAARRRTGAAIAPFYIDQEAPLRARRPAESRPAQGEPSQQPPQYAVTWYGLAIAILIAALVLLALARRRGLRHKPLLYKNCY
mgnify:CR=1 FL=1